MMSPAASGSTATAHTAGAAVPLQAVHFNIITVGADALPLNVLLVVIKANLVRKYHKSVAIGDDPSRIHQFELDEFTADGEVVVKETTNYNEVPTRLACSAELPSGKIKIIVILNEADSD